MKKLLLALLIIAAQHDATAQLNYTYSKRLDDVFDSVCNRFKIKGVSASIVVPNEGTWERCYGVSHPGVPISKDMYLGIGSNTKTYFSALMLKLQEQGKLDLDDTIGTWVQHPNIPGHITIRQCLNHTSGLFSFTSSSKMNDYILPDYTKIWPIDSVLNMVEPPVAAPGGAWDYCNTNYTIAGLIVRSVTGKALHVALRDEILTPQGLNETFFYPFETPNGTIPHSWSAVLSSGSAMDDLVVTHSYSHNAVFSLASSAGAIMATARDNALFWDKLMSGKILNTSSMAEFETLVPVSPAQGYGLGVFKLNSFNGRTIVSHGGTNFGFINDNIHDKTSGVSITMLTNQDSVSNSVLLGNCISALHKVTIQYTGIDEATITQSNIQVYPNPANNELNISVDDKGQAYLYDITGKAILNSALTTGTNKISLHALAAGTYYINITTGDNTVHRQTIQVLR